MFLAVLAFAFSSVAMAATPGDEVPFREGEPMPPAPPGMSWCLIQKPAVYDTVTETVTVRPAANFQVPVPGEYSTKNEILPSTPAYRTGRVVPAQLQTVSVPYTIQEEYVALKVNGQIIQPTFTEVPMEVEMCPAYDQIRIIPAQFRDVPKRIVVEPARKAFQRVTCDDGNLCWTVCETPAKYRDVVTKELVADAREERVTVPARTQRVMVRKVARPAVVEEVRMPAQQGAYQKQQVVTPARVEWQTVPATTQTVAVLVETKAPSFAPQAIPEKKETISRRVLKSPASMVWRLQSNTAYAPAPVAETAAVEYEYESVPGAGVRDSRYTLK
ncbi:MAG: hypothetical protein LIP23_05280 [Planctomycetes bacterium]|nr:hypothetical protein [Planctomycetota bacterium]